MNVLEAVKKFFLDDTDKRYEGNITELPHREKTDQPPLTAFETRRTEIAESTEPIEGIFYIYDGQIIPDYYSECLIADKDSPHRKEMYHMNFYPNYMRRKFDGLSYSEKSLPRGRSFIPIKTAPIIFIDKCYAHNKEIIKQIIELYRLPQGVSISDNSEYRCPACYDKQ